jgi:hypothetical protein
MSILIIYTNSMTVLMYALDLTLPLFDHDFKHENTLLILKQCGMIFL